MQTPINNMVTSPPYYNAREYSQWKNLFNYLSDMFNVNLKAHDSLIEGGIFFYNIGDIFDNENVIKSKMGEKRIPLGAYAILIFEKAGFETLDDIIWHKGEPQSNRHKNDGNYTPYYQRPANCYEHMFIFRKKGKLKINQTKEEVKIKKNIINFTPVFKIGRNGENKYGHTAPFPKMVPLLSVSTFTNKGDSVLDPFSGSGTTAIVANSKNRTGIGIEMNPDYALLSIEKAKEEKIKSSLIKFMPRYRIKTLEILNKKAKISSEVSLQLNVNRASMSRILRVLKEKELVSATSNKARTVVYSISKKGKKVLKEIK